MCRMMKTLNKSQEYREPIHGSKHKAKCPKERHKETVRTVRNGQQRSVNLPPAIAWPYGNILILYIAFVFISIVYSSIFRLHTHQCCALIMYLLLSRLLLCWRSPKRSCMSRSRASVCPRSRPPPPPLPLPRVKIRTVNSSGIICL